MANYKDLFIAQVGKETTWGCDVAPTVKLMGVESVDIQPIRETEQVKVLDGRFSPSAVALRTKHGGEATLTGLLVYEDVGLWMDGIFGGVASTTVTGCTTDATGVVRAYLAPLTTYSTTMDAPSFYTLAYGEATLATTDATTDTPVISLISALAKNFKVTGESGAPAKIEVGFIGQDVEADNFTTDVAVVDRSVSYVMGDHWVLSIDPATDAVGTTAWADLAFKFELDVDTGRYVQYHLGDLVPDSYANATWSGTLMLTLQVGGKPLDAITSMLTSTPVQRVIRLKATSSSNYFQIDFGGVLLEAPSLFTDMDGVATVEMTFQGIYQATLANWLKITMHNGVSAHATMA